MNVQDEIKALKQRISELENQVEQEKEFPQDGDEYWYISLFGSILSEDWIGDPSEKRVLEVGNVYKTEQQARFALEKLKVEAELRKFSRPFEYGKFNYYLFFDIESDRLVADFTSYCPPQGAIYFESEDEAIKAIRSVGEERIKKYIFGVEDYYETSSY